jgi:hypothetical protein
MTFMTSRTAPWSPRTRAAVSTAAATASAAVAGFFFAASAGALTGAATSTLVSLTISDVPALHLTAFQGSYGTSGVPELGGENAGDSSDPDGVLTHVTLSGPGVSRTSSSSGKNSAQAQFPGATGASPKQPPSPFILKLNDRTLFQIGSMDSYSECTPPPVGPGALAYVHIDATSLKVLGKTVAVGRTSIPVTGTEIGVPAVATGTVTVVYKQVATPPAQTAGVSTATAHIDLTFSGTFQDSGGKQVYSGPMERLTLGTVRVTCPGVVPTTPASPSPASAPTPSPPADPTAPTGPPTAATTDPSGPTTHAPAQPRPSGPPGPPTGSDGGSGGAGGGGTRGGASGGVPKTAGPSGWWPVMSGLGLAAGGGLFATTRRRGRHQN